MKSVAAAKLPRLFLTLLLASGLTWAFLGALNLGVSPLPCLELCLLEALILEAVGFSRRSALWGSSAIVLALAFWLLGGGGASVFSDLLRALSLQLSGIQGALPLVAREASLVFTALLTLLSFLCARKGAGGMGAMLLLVGSLLMLWLADRTDLTVRLLPAGIAALTLLILERHQESSFLRVLSWAAALVLLAWGLTPAEGLLSPELKKRADSFRQTVMDRLFFTEPRDVFSLSSEGFYPQGISQLGGPVTPSDHPVMQVSSPRNVYLRGVILNEYDGRSWRNTLGGRRYLWDAGGVAVQRSVLFDQNLPSPELTSSLTASSDVSVRMLGDGASTLFIPQRVRSLRTGGELVPYFTNSSELFITRNLQAGDTWSVSAPLFQAGDSGLGTLVNAAAGDEDAQWESVRETYTVLPSHLEEPVWQMAADLTEGIFSPYEKAITLQNYLSRNYRYTLDVAYHSASLDFVTAFLFGSKEGYCTYFASAMTVLCRMAGLPARYVEGYLAEPDARGEALVTGLNAHAWTEVYFRGFGWVTFDATPHLSGSGGSEPPAEDPSVSAETPTPEPAGPTPSPIPPDTAESPRPSDAPADSQEPSGPDEPPAGSGNAGGESSSGDSASFPFLPILILILLLLAGGAWLRWALTSPVRRAGRAVSEESRFDLWLDDVLSRLSAAGLTRSPGEALMSFTRRLDAEESLPVRLSQLGECASLLHYGKVHALETDTSLARDASLKLKKSLSRRARLRYAVRRLKFRRR